MLVLILFLDIVSSKLANKQVISFIRDSKSLVAELYSTTKLNGTFITHTHIKIPSNKHDKINK